ncbi:type I DNA topoisomerase, partial [Candidatus Saccharibacteria bacterium]|nr:type I DNA topoisomerase [Candidatus Saccharibacteria bacterium]
IKEAIENPRGVDINIVNAQQARRVLDRLVGYELSPILWKKVQPGLSAGRVQSIAVKLIVNREREIRDFKAESAFKILATLSCNDSRFKAELNEKITDEKKVKKFLEDCQKSLLTVEEVDKKPSSRSPGAPFITSTLQQEASRKLGFSVKQTMTLAQRLYENGHITYMRTDSTHVSTVALGSCKKYIIENYGSDYHKSRQYQPKSSSAQQAHEAIRPTDISQLQAGENTAQNKLYNLIWKRMVASQMAAAQTLKTEVKISISNRPEMFIAKGEELQFDGFYKVWGGSKEDTLLPSLQQGYNPKIIEVSALQTFNKPNPRYSEASLVKTLEDLGIGRPSTYAPTISAIQNRGYVEKSDVEGAERKVIEYTSKKGTINRTETIEKYGTDRNKLIPTHLAYVVTDFLDKHFTSIMDTGFTANAEKRLDEISEGKLVWHEVIKEFYNQFHPLTQKASEVSRQEASQARLVGKDPKSHKPIYARFGRYGPMLQRGETEDNSQKPDFAPLPKDTTIETVSLEQALKMFELPRKVGKTKDGQEITANIGRFGPYIKVADTFVSIKPLDPFSISEAQARQLYISKLELNQKKQIKIFDDESVKILMGPYGPYVTDGTKNAKIPKTINPKELSLEQAKELLSATPVSNGKRRKSTK